MHSHMNFKYFKLLFIADASGIKLWHYTNRLLKSRTKMPSVFSFFEILQHSSSIQQ